MLGPVIERVKAIFRGDFENAQAVCDNQAKVELG
jgi:hypothetical protein